MKKTTTPALQIINQRSNINWTPYLATGYAEGFEGKGSTAAEQLEAWAYLIKTGMVWDLQGSFGRTAAEIIKKKLINYEGVIAWDAFDKLNNND